MSHFCVMVIGEDHENQLGAYHEFECTGVNDKYVLDVDVTEEVVKEGLDWFGLEDKTVLSLDEVDKEGQHKYGYAVVDKEGNTIQAFNRTNPNKKWDWYQLGGRWSGFFLVKDGAEANKGSAGLMGSCRDNSANSADQCFKKDIDINGMYQREIDSGLPKFDAVQEILKTIEPPIKWSEFRGQYDDIDTARKKWHSHPFNVEINKQKLSSFMGCDHEQYRIGQENARELFIEDCKCRALTPFAFLKDGEWVEKGEMGWFGCVSNEKLKYDWSAQFRDMFEALPDDTLISMVDCHI